MNACFSLPIHGCHFTMEADHNNVISKGTHVQVEVCILEFAGLVLVINFPNEILLSPVKEKVCRIIQWTSHDAFHKHAHGWRNRCRCALNHGNRTVNKKKKCHRQLSFIYQIFIHVSSFVSGQACEEHYAWFIIEL